MENNNKIPAMMIDGKLIDFTKLSINELDELKERVEKRQAEVRKELHAMLEE